MSWYVVTCGVVRMYMSLCAHGLVSSLGSPLLHYRSALSFPCAYIQLRNEIFWKWVRRLDVWVTPNSNVQPPCVPCSFIYKTLRNSAVVRTWNGALPPYCSGGLYLTRSLDPDHYVPRHVWSMCFARGENSRYWEGLCVHLTKTSSPVPFQ